jgi:Ca2+-binding RTX toxin-like protein
VTQTKQPPANPGRFNPDGGAVSVRNFVEAAITVGGNVASTIAVTEAKRGSIVTGSGDDTLTVASYSNKSGTGNTMMLDSGAGNDTIGLTAHSRGWTMFDVRSGAGADSIAIAGRSNDIVQAGDGDDAIDAGAGNDRLTGGLGRDVFTVRLGSDSDTVTDFADGTDLLRLAGIASTSVTVSATAAGARVAWGTADGIVLAGVNAALISGADLMFA